MNEITKSFNKIALLPDKWDHNRQYERIMLNEVPLDSYVLDIGCGTGEFAKKLSEIAVQVDAIDLSPVMIEQAMKRHSAENINYKVIDFYDIDEKQKYDCIISVAAFHHLELDTALPRVNRLLKAGGALIVLDLYKRKGIADRLLDLIAIPANLVVQLVKNKSLKQTEQEKFLWEEHSKYDKYNTFKELKSIYSSYLPGEYKIKRLLFWRYLLTYRKPI